MRTLLLVNPLRGVAVYLELLEVLVEGGSAKAVARVLWSNDPQIDNGWARLTRTAEKWYRVDAKLAKALMPREAMRRFAPVYEVVFSDVERCVTVTVTSGMYLSVGLADARMQEGVVRVRHLFEADDLQRFLKGEEVFYELAVSALSVLESELIKFSSRFADVTLKVSEVMAGVVDRTPSAFDLIATVLAKYNVEPRDIVEFAAAEAAVRKMLEERAQAERAQAAKAGEGK